MNDETNPSMGRGRGRPWRLLLAPAFAAAGGGALWSGLAGPGCRACGSAAALTGGLPLAWLGVAYYTLALAALAVGRFQRPGITKNATDTKHTENAGGNDPEQLSSS